MQIEDRAADETNPKRLLAAVEDEAKRKALDDLVRSAKAFLHSGRHVSMQVGSTEQGKYPADHRDAENALLQTRALVAYLAKLMMQ